MTLEKKIVTGTVFIYQVFKMASKVDYLSGLNTQADFRISLPKVQLALQVL
jgi:hypothetical protein